MEIKRKTKRNGMKRNEEKKRKQTELKTRGKAIYVTKFFTVYCRSTAFVIRL